MKFDYDETTDSLYISFVDGSGADTVIINDDVVADVDATGKLVGLDIQHASKTANLGQLVLAGFTPTTLPNQHPNP